MEEKLPQAVKVWKKNQLLLLLKYELIQNKVTIFSLCIDNSLNSDIGEDEMI